MTGKVIAIVDYLDLTKLNQDQRKEKVFSDCSENDTNYEVQAELAVSSY